MQYRIKGRDAQQKQKRKVPDLQPFKLCASKVPLIVENKLIFNDLDLHHDPTLYESSGSVSNYVGRLRFRLSVTMVQVPLWPELLDKKR